MPGKYDQQHLKNVDKYAAQIDDLYATAIDAVAKMLAVNDVDSIAHTKIRAEATKFFNGFNSNLGGTIRNGMKEEWKLANNKSDALVKQVVGNNPDKRYLQGNEDALQSFIGRQRDGLKLSDRVWNLTKEFKNKLEEGLKSGVGTGQGHKLLAQDLMQYLNQQQGTNPGTGVYKDPRANARRLARTETNMAYHEADWERWQQMDFVIGYEVEVSNNGHHCPLCLQLQGKYPKWFKFRSWHPQCYSDDTEVYTNHGWKLFADVTMDDQVLSLNPDTKNVEWAGIIEQVKYFHVGDMIRFHNRSLDMLVTPDHPIKYLTGRGQWMEKPASEFKGGILYRSSEYQGKSPEYFQIGSKQIPFTLFCQFMGYYLADGSIAQKKKSQVHIAQRSDNDTVNWAIMGDILHELPYKICQVESGFYIFDQELHDYLAQFGKAPDKFIPEVIKNASTRCIWLFLDAFLSCDGHVRQPKSFIGSRGNVFTGKNPEKQYYSTSKQLAGDIGELMLKVGKRPSFSVDKIKGKHQEFKNGTYTINSDMVRINELNSQTATVFNKDVIHYHGNVYDLELDRNHLMYVRRNGKCVWGSNCMCHATAILADDIDNPESDPNAVTQVPAGFAKWVKDNEERSKGKPQPYFVRDNFKGGKLTGGLLKPESMPVGVNGKKEGKLNEVIDLMKDAKIDYLEVKKLPKKLSEKGIIERLGGGDITKGSCSSLAFAYAGNKAGLDVLDFRDGASRKMFASTGNILKIANKVGGTVSKDTNDFVKAKELLNITQKGREYYFICGNHAAIVRKAETGYEYLELQSATKNGFKPLTNYELKNRFGAKKSRTLYGQKYETTDCIIDIDLLKNDGDFQELLGYINTAEGEQRKGVTGSIR